MLFYNPEDPIAIPEPLERALHHSQLLPSLVIGAGGLLLLAGLAGDAGPVWNWSWGFGFAAALTTSLAVPMWCGICHDRSVPSRALGGLRALGIWLGYQGLLLAISVVFWGLMIDLAGLWPDLRPPAPPARGPVPVLAPAPLSRGPCPTPPRSSVSQRGPHAPTV